MARYAGKVAHFLRSLVENGSWKTMENACFGRLHSQILGKSRGKCFFWKASVVSFCESLVQNARIEEVRTHTFCDGLVENACLRKSRACGRRKGEGQGKGKGKGKAKSLHFLCGLPF